MVVYQLIFFLRAKSSKVRQRKRVGHNDVIVENKGDIHYVYCNITGLNYVTPKYPKFKLEIFFEKCLSPVIDKLVCSGGPFEGFSQLSRVTIMAHIRMKNCKNM